MGSGALCMGCNLREENPAPQARKSMRVQPARMRGVRRILWEVIHSIMSGGFYGKWYALCKL